MTDGRTDGRTDKTCKAAVTMATEQYNRRAYTVFAGRKIVLCAVAFLENL